MTKVGLLRRAGVILVVCAATAIAASAQAFTSLYSFNGTDGAQPLAPLIQATDGNFYGTTNSGGAYLYYGTVFKITPGGTLTTLYNFCAQANCPDGANPYAGLMQATDGNLYGTTFYGGGTPENSTGSGVVFKITPTGTLTKLYGFCPGFPNCPDGANPTAGLLQATDGNFYGTTTGGGTSNWGGTVFKITPGGTLTTLYSFCAQANCSDGDNPAAGLIQATDGDFYGTTSSGGAYGNYGTVFKITPGGTLTTLYNFCAPTKCAGGRYPQGGLIQATDGDFYGTTSAGGAYNRGTVYKITPGGSLTTLYSFCAQGYPCPDGANPGAGLMQATDGNFYGTTRGLLLIYGYTGTVFEMTPGGTLGTLYSFTGGADGGNPSAGLVQATDGSFYGTTAGGQIYGNNGDGTIFRLVVVPAVTLTPTSVNFGKQILNQTSAAKTVTLKNSGTGLPIVTSVAIEGSSFAISANTCNGATVVACEVSVTFTPAALGNLTGTLTFTDNAPNSPQTVPLSGRGIEPATLTPSISLFGTWEVGSTSTAKTFTLTNHQSVALTSIAISTTGDFAVSATTCTTSLVAKGTCTISVTFMPTVLGKREGQLSVSDTASNSPQTSALTGTGGEPATLTPPFASFGTWAVGSTSTAKTFTLTNYQSVALTSIAISITGDFAVSATTCTTSLAAHSKCTINATFTPTAKGTRTGKLSVTDSASNPQKSNLSGTGQ